MLHTAFLDMLLNLLGATRKLCAYTTTRSNDARQQNSKNPSGYGPFRLLHRHSSLEYMHQPKWASIAVEDMFKMSSMHD